MSWSAQFFLFEYAFLTGMPTIILTYSHETSFSPLSPYPCHEQLDMRDQNQHLKKQEKTLDRIGAVHKSQFSSNE